MLPFIEHWHFKGKVMFAKKGESMRILSFNLCLLLLVCVYRNAYAARRFRFSPLAGDGINFPRRTLTKTQAANFVSSILIQNFDFYQ